MSDVPQTPTFRTHGMRRPPFAASVSVKDSEVMRLADQANSAAAAYARFAVAVIVAALLLWHAPQGMGGEFGQGAALANLGLALAGFVLVRRGKSTIWLPHILAFLDVALVLGVIFAYPYFPDTLPRQFTPNVIATWGIFLVLGLSAVRGRPEILVAQTVLFAAGFVSTFAGQPSLAPDDPAVPRALEAVLGFGYNSMRTLVILATGTLLVAATLRARTNLWNAIVASRRASSLSRYFAPTIAAIVVDAELASLREGRRQTMSVLFADIRGFTRMSETLAPEEIAAFLNRFRRLATEAIEANGGVVDKFVGDEVMALFGLPIPGPTDPGNAVRAGQRLLRDIADWAGERASLGLSPVSVGVGLNCGPVFVGALGDGRLEFTVLGDTVNVAPRLEELTKPLDRDFIASADAIEAASLDPAARRGWTTLPRQSIRGRRDGIETLAWRQGSVSET